MRVRVIIALLILVVIAGALVAAEALIRRPISFEVIAQTEVIEGRIKPVAGNPIGFEIASSQVCDGEDDAAWERETVGPCDVFAQARKIVSAKVSIQSPVHGKVLRRAKGELIVLLEAVEDTERTDTCEKGMVALLQDRLGTEGQEPTELCSPVRIAVPAALAEMPRLTLRGEDGRIGHAIGENTTITTPSIVKGAVTMRSSSLLRDLDRYISGQDIGPARFAIDVGEQALNFGEAFSACRDPYRCGSEATKPAPFVAVIGAHESGGLRVHAYIVGAAGIVESYGSLGEIVKPRWFARIVDDPHVGWLYVIVAFLLGLVLKVDRWIFAARPNETGGR